MRKNVYCKIAHVKLEISSSLFLFCGCAHRCAAAPALWQPSEQPLAKRPVLTILFDRIIRCVWSDRSSCRSGHVRQWVRLFRRVFAYAQTKFAENRQEVNRDMNLIDNTVFNHFARSNVVASFSIAIRATLSATRVYLKAQMSLMPALIVVNLVALFRPENKR